MAVDFLKGISKELKSVETLIGDRLKSEYSEVSPLVEHSLKKNRKNVEACLCNSLWKDCKN
ncbi:hypothetical protein [Thermotomaculum hydrothermale]|uniref:hypothetical protein n=1 Tax=Thermotomaculum hydrothermale TaxID=981385 RepID=UPI001915CF72|nr:hypothetical protein [Thermotomaculum hydrothermale]